MGSARRYYLHKHQAAAARDDGLAGVWAAKQQVGGTALPTHFPHRSALNDRGYVALEDLDGVTAAELMRVGFEQRQANAILVALK